MAGQIFAYITHKAGKADDSALELATAAGKIYPDASMTAIVTGAGADLDAVCNEVAKSYQEVWKFDHDALAYPNGEAIRKLLVAVLPQNAILLAAHDTFGMDLCPGLSIKLDAVFAADIVDIEGLEGNILNVIRQEYSGQVSTHVTCDIVNGAVQISADQAYNLIEISVLSSTDSGGFKIGEMSGATTDYIGDQLFSFSDTVADSDGDSAGGVFDITIGSDLTTFLGVDDDGSTTGN